MSVESPKTLSEWKAYTETLSGEALRDQGIAVNSATFVRMLQEEEYSAEEIHTILIYFAQRFATTGQRPPDGLYDFARLARTEPPAG